MGPSLIEVKLCTAKWTQVPVGHAKFDVNRCNESPLRGENPDFWTVSKFNTDSLPLRAILPVKNKHRVFSPTAGTHCAIFPKLCMVTELVDTIEKCANHFLIQLIVFPTGCTEKFGLIGRHTVSLL